MNDTAASRAAGAVSRWVKENGRGKRLAKKRDSGPPGQDLIEYELLVVLIARASIFGMPSVASDLNSAFTKVGRDVTPGVTSAALVR